MPSDLLSAGLAHGSCPCGPAVHGSCPCDPAPSRLECGLAAQMHLISDVLKHHSATTLRNFIEGAHLFMESNPKQRQESSEMEFSRTKHPLYAGHAWWHVVSHGRVADGGTCRGWWCVSCTCGTAAAELTHAQASPSAV